MLWLRWPSFLHFISILYAISQNSNSNQSSSKKKKLPAGSVPTLFFASVVRNFENIRDLNVVNLGGCYFLYSLDLIDAEIGDTDGFRQTLLEYAFHALQT